MKTATQSVKNITTKRRRFRALTTAMAIIAGAVAIGLPASPAAASGGGDSGGSGGGTRAVQITTYGARNLPQGGVTVKVQKVGDNTPIGTCTTNALGVCTVSSSSFGGSDYYAEETGATSPYNTVAKIVTGTNGSAAPYRKTFTIPSGSTANVSIFTRRNNPIFPARCGLKVALVVDTSASTDGVQDAYKSAAKGFVDTLAGTPSSIGVWSFATTAANQIGLTAATNSAVIKAAIDDLPAPAGNANWDDGIYQVASVGADLVVVITGGNPTTNSGVAPLTGGTSSTARIADVEGGVWAANSVKAAGAKVVILGIGSAFSDPTNLAQVSGPNANDDYYVANNVSSLDGLLSQVASKTCGGTVTVQKRLQTTPDGDFVGTSGWNYVPTVTSGGGSIASAPANGTTAGPDGLVNFAYSGGTWPKTVTVTETMQGSQYALQTQGGKNAACTANGAPLTVTNVGLLGVSFSLTQSAIVDCIFTNVTRGSITIVNAANPQLADDFSFTSSTLGNFSLDDDGDKTNALSNSKVFANLQPGTYDVQELAPPGWALDNIECSNSDSTVAGSTASIVMGAGENVVCTFTNNAAPASIVVDTTAVGGDGDFDFALAAGDAIDLPVTTTDGFGTTSSVPLVPGTSYTLGETDPGTAWIAGPLTCEVLHVGADSAVALPLSFTALPGDAITCSVTNTKKGTIIVVKNVAGANGTFDFDGSFTDPFQITTDALTAGE